MGDLFIGMALVLAGAFVLFLLVRNELVYRAHRRRIKEVGKLAREKISRGDFDWEYLYDDTGDYDRDLWRFGAWTYEQFFPNPPGESARRDEK